MACCVLALSSRDHVNVAHCRDPICSGSLGFLHGTRRQAVGFPVGLSFTDVKQRESVRYHRNCEF